MSEASKAPPLNELFSKHVNTIFTMCLEAGGRFDLELRSCDVHVANPGHENFSLEFLGPLDAPLVQGIYRLANEQMGDMDIFLVPIARESAGTVYEAVFNLVR